jgi:O-antigen/teichoic acid export membrane protein
VLSVLIPRFAVAAKSEESLARLAKFVAGVVAVLSIPLTVGIISTAHLIVPLVMGASYVAAIPVVRVMAPYLITSALASLLAGTILYAMEQHRAYLASTGGGAVAGSILYLTLIPVMGLTGASLAFVLAELCVAAIAFALVPVSVRQLWRNSIIAVASCGALVMAIVIKLVAQYDSRPLVLIPVGALAYVLSCGPYIKRWLAAQLQPSISSPSAP